MKRLLIALALCLLTTTAWSQDTWSAASKIERAHWRQSALRQVSMAQSQTFEAFIAIDDAAVIEALRKTGVKVSATFDGFVTAVIPASALEKVGTLPGVRHVALARNLHLCNDTARARTGVEALHGGIGMATPLTGKDVIVGMIDLGIDFNHINLCDSTGKSRVLAAYLPFDTLGVAPVIDGETLPGSCYETPEQIAALTTDNAHESHGTHTTGTAAGSYRGNGAHGMAPDANIVACGLGNRRISDVTIVNSIRYIFDYADRVGKPCVINMSLGSTSGPNDGTSFLCRSFETMTGPGRVCVVAAGNDGGVPICFHASLDGDTVTTLLRNQWGSTTRNTELSMWSDGAQVHRARVVIINRATGVLEYASPFFGTVPGDSVVRVDDGNDELFAQYYSGSI